MTGFFLQFIKRLILCALIFAFGNAVILCQSSLSGNLNQPKSHVSVIGPGPDRVTVDNITGFSVNDTILLIQMQGVQILTAATYGFAQGKTGEPGMHEFMIISSVTPIVDTIGEIVFRNDILNVYDETGNVQIVRVPYLNSATITGKLFCDPWNPGTKSGGVLALIVARTLTLNADIDVSGLGFKGGKDTIGDGICWTTNPALYGLEFYPRSFRNAGFKGEGVANLNESDLPLGTNYMKGLGNNWTGGGGGNGRYSGGGGGSNRGAGGVGGFEDCFPAKAGGNGGVTAVHPSLVDRIYFGGGGGASTSASSGPLSNGGNGGGIVIIVADAIAGNGGNILADGSNGLNRTGIGGSGGGGAGGSIALSLNNYGTSPIEFSIKGGNGGDNLTSFGEGGGGGGGLLYVSTNTSANVTTTMGGGLPGNDGGSTASGGTIGENRPNFKAVLNGFLFNSISSSVTGNQVDAICSNMLPKKIIGTIPVGGTGPYIFLWEKSYDLSNWIPLTNDTDPVNYTPTVIETSTVWYRRTITDSSIPDVLVDVSKPVQIVVQPYIKNNIVGNSDTLCYGQNPVLLTSKATLQDGIGVYSFKWDVSLNSINFDLPVNANTAEGYTPPGGLTVTSWYRRTVTSGKCIDSSAFAKLTVLPVIAGNIITNAPPDICYGSLFQNITASVSPALSGGDLTYRISWEASTNGSTGWSSAAGIIIPGGFNPDESSASFPGSLYFRRVVKSGSNDVCVDNSVPVKLNDYPVIVNNAIKTITINKPVCSGSDGPQLTDSLTISGGNSSYAYSWEYRTSTQPWTAVAGATSADYLPGVLNVSADFRRTAISSACSDISNIISITAHAPILNNSVSLLSLGTDTTVCNGGNPTGLIGSVPTGGINSYAYLWLSSTDNATWNQIPSGTSKDYDPPVLTVPTYYKRQVISGACLVVSASTVNVNVLPLIGNNTITGTSSVCKYLIPDAITGGALTGGSGTYNYLWQQSIDGGSVWIPAALINNGEDYQPPALTVPVKYRRTVTSGLKNTCQSTSNVFDITIDPLPASQIDAGPDTAIFTIEKIYRMKAISPLTGETGAWTPLSDDTDIISDKNDAGITGLATGINTFVWTVTRGPCKLSDTVNIEVYKDLFPQGFSPNGDTYNNDFVIEGLDLEDHYVDLRIVNGAGTEVYKTSNRNGQNKISWDGKNEKGFDLPEGTYYYMIQLSSKKSNASLFRKSGFIILKRY